MKIEHVIIILLLAILMLGARFSSDRGRQFLPVVSAAVPAEPYDCTSENEGELIYVNDTNDTAESWTCHCGIDADDATYEWLKNEDPTVDCF